MSPCTERRGCATAAPAGPAAPGRRLGTLGDRKSTRLNSSLVSISYAVFCLKKKNKRSISANSPGLWLPRDRFLGSSRRASTETAVGHGAISLVRVYDATPALERRRQGHHLM